MTVFIFAGTGDGRKFIVSLLERAWEKGMKLEARVFCATEYGAELVEAETAKALSAFREGGEGPQTVVASSSTASGVG